MNINEALKKILAKGIFFVKKNYKLIVYLTIILSILPRLANLSAPIVDLNSFRQTQTAITVTAWLQDEAMGVNESTIDKLLYYKTPVFGKPFMVPLEFPFYQFTAYLLVKSGVENVDVAGRIASIIFYALSAFLLFLILVELKFHQGVIVLSVFSYSFCLFSIFWSRTFSIEFCAVFFGLLFLYSYQKILSKHNQLIWFVVCVIAGIMAYLIKITSVLPYLLAIFFLFLKEIDISSWLRDFKLKLILNRVISNRRLIIISALVVGIPLVIELFWLSHSNGIKLQNSFTKTLTSSALTDWNYGQFEDKIDPRNWKELFKRITFSVMPLWLLLVIPYQRSVRSFVSGKIWICLGVTFFLPIFIFWNLYFIHDYYLSAVLPTLSIISGLALMHFLNFFYINLNNWRITFPIIIVIGVMQYFIASKFPFSYQRNYQITLTENRNVENHFYKTYEMAREINRLSSFGDLVIVTGFDWTSEILYYAERRGLMMVSDLKEDQTYIKGDGYKWLVSKDPTRFPKLFDLFQLELVQEKYGLKYYRIIE